MLSINRGVAIWTYCHLSQYLHAHIHALSYVPHDTFLLTLEHQYINVTVCVLAHQPSLITINAALGC